MSKKKNWQHWNGGSHGTMICTACHKKVAEGQYRVYETEEGFHVQHRACSKDDPTWAVLDASRATEIQSTRDRLATYLAFRDTWNESALNGEIEDMQTFLDSDHVKAFEALSSASVRSAST